MKTFSERLRYLMNQEEITDHNDLAVRLIKGGFIERDTNNDSLAKMNNSKKKNNIAKIIQRHLEDNNEPNTKYLKYYANFFGCSYDFLLGVIDTPLHKEDEIQESLGLTKNAIRNLSESNKTKLNLYTSNNSHYVVNLVNILLDYKNTKSDIKNKRQHLFTMHKLYKYLTFVPVSFTNKHFEVINNIGLLDFNLKSQEPIRAYQLEDLQRIELLDSLKDLKGYVYKVPLIPQEDTLNTLLVLRKSYNDLQKNKNTTEDELRDIKNSIITFSNALATKYQQYLLDNDFSKINKKYHGLLEDLRLLCKPDKDTLERHLI